MNLRWIENLREKFTSGGVRLFSAPYLPGGLRWAAVLLVFTDLMAILLAQPAGYWLTNTRAESGIPFLRSLLAAGPGWYALAALGYLVLIGLGLTLLNRPTALALWLSLCFVHLNHLLSWLAGKLSAGNPLENALELVGVQVLTGLVLGVVLSALLLRRKTEADPGRLAARLQVGLPLAWVLLLVALVGLRAWRPGSGWQLLKPEHTPGHRALAAVAYDPLRGNTVLFGGFSDFIGNGFMYTNDTWTWNGVDWQEMKPEHQPAPRAGAALAFDEKRGVMVLFGGEDKSSMQTLGDTWLWDGKDWKQVFPLDAPSARRGAQLFYDVESGKMMLSGGFTWWYKDRTPQQFGDTWAWDGENWQHVLDSTQNILSTSASAVYDPLRKRTVVFDTDGLLFWQAGRWTKSSANGLLGTRFGSALALNPQNGKILLFGGLVEGRKLNDTWLLDGETWQQLTPELAPSARDSQMMFYDPVRKSFIVYGGMIQYTLDDMWEFAAP